MQFHATTRQIDTLHIGITGNQQMPVKPLEETATIQSTLRLFNEIKQWVYLMFGGPFIKQQGYIARRFCNQAHTAVRHRIAHKPF